jgi:hypothetical protein
VACGSGSGQPQHEMRREQHGEEHGETHAAPRAPPAQLHRHGVVRAARRRKGGTVAAAWSK